MSISMKTATLIKTAGRSYSGTPFVTERSLRNRADSLRGSLPGPSAAGLTDRLEIYWQSTNAAQLEHQWARRKRLGLLWLLIMSLLLMSHLSVPGDAAGEEPIRQVVRIDGNRSGPISVDVVPGTTVLWMNEQNRPVRVKFARPVVTTCKDPKSFAAGNRGVRVSEELHGGDIASLCFLEANDYPFRVELAEGEPTGGAPAMIGTIHVGEVVQ